MDKIDNIMALAYKLRDTNTNKWDVSEAVEASKALRTALTELASTATEYQQAADKMAMEHKTERDTLRQQLAEAQAEVTRLEPLQFRQAPCHKFCEATAFEIEIRNLKKQLAEAQALIEASRKQEPIACIYNGNQYMRHEFMTDKIPEGSTPLYENPVVAPDVLKELLWIRTAFAKDPETGGVVIKDVHGKEVSKWIDRVDALGGAND